MRQSRKGPRPFPSDAWRGWRERSHGQALQRHPHPSAPVGARSTLSVQNVQEIPMLRSIYLGHCRLIRPLRPGRHSVRFEDLGDHILRDIGFYRDGPAVCPSPHQRSRTPLPSSEPISDRTDKHVAEPGLTRARRVSWLHVFTGRSDVQACATNAGQISPEPHVPDVHCDGTHPPTREDPVGRSVAGL
jgi:hypothetical protein